MENEYTIPIELAIDDIMAETGLEEELLEYNSIIDDSKRYFDVMGATLNVANECDRTPYTIMKANNDIKNIANGIGLDPNIVSFGMLGLEEYERFTTEQNVIAFENVVVNFILLLIDKLKITFQKAGLLFKNIYTKILVATSNVSKRAETARVRLKSYGTTVSSELSKRERENIINHIGVVLAANNISNDNALSSSLAEYLNLISDYRQQGNMINGMDKLKDYVLKKNNSLTSEEVTASYKELETVINTINTDGVSYNKYINIFIEEVSKSNIISGTLLRPVFISAYGVDIKVFGFDKTSDEIMPKIESVTIDDDRLDKLNVFIPNVSTIEKILDSVVMATGKTKTLYDQYHNQMKTIEQHFEDIKHYKDSHKELNPETSKYFTMLYEYGRLIGTRIKLDSIIGQIRGTKNTLVCCELYINKYRK